MPKVTVLGSNGYIGQHITHRLFEQGYTDLNLFDIHDKSLFSQATYQQLNILQPINGDVKAILAQSDYIFLFIGLTGTFASIEKYQAYLDINEAGLLKILNSLVDAEHKPKIIFPSTRLVYKGVENTLLKEEAEKEFKTVYAVNKFACEHYLKIFNDLYGITYTTFRICVPYGNVLSNGLSFGTLSHFIKKAESGQNITLYGDGQLKRTFTHIQDLTELLILGGMSSLTNNQIFNIGSTDHLSLFQVAKAIADLYSVQVEFTPFPKTDMVIESGDTLFDGSKLTELIGYKYQHSFHSWISKI